MWGFFVSFPSFSSLPPAPLFSDAPVRPVKIFSLEACPHLEKMQDLILLFVLLGCDLRMRWAYLWVCRLVYILKALQALDFWSITN